MPDSAYSLLFSSGNQETQTPSTEGSVTAPVPTPTSGGSGSSAFGLLFGGSSPESPLSGQGVGGSAPTQHLYQDSTQPWYKRAWDFANTPLTESLFGLPEDRPGAGGFERGIEHIASGFTSPLSIALTAATFGTGGLVESAGVTALKEAGLTAAEIADATKASQVALDATRALKPIEPAIQDALTAGGHDLGLLDRARKVVAPLNRDAELANPEIQSGLSKLGLTPEQRTAFEEGKLSGKSLPEKATQEEIAAHKEAEAKARQSIATANGGFSDDELKALAGTGRTVAGAKAGFTPVVDAVRGEFGVSPEMWNKATKALGDEVLGTPAGDEALAKAGFSPQEIETLNKADKAVGIWKKAQGKLYDSGLTEQDLFGKNLLQNSAFQILHHTVPDLPIAVTARAAKTANALLNAGFTLQQFETASAMSPRFLDALKEGDYDKAWEYGTEAFAGGALGVLGASHALHSAGELSQPLIEPNKSLRPSDEYLAMQRANQEKEALYAVAEQHGINIDKVRYDILGHQKPGIFGLPKEVKARQDLELATVLHHVVTGGDTTKAGWWHDALSEAAGRNEEPAIARPNNGQTANPDVQKLAQDYTASAGIDKAPHEGLVSIDPEAAKRVADAYDLMKHNPDDPKVKASYDALIRETKAQWDAAKAAGYTLEPWPHPGQPYADSGSPSKAMAEDVRNNKHLYYYTGGEVPENHPLSGTDPATGETYNNIFRAVHDLFGHAKNGYEFGPRGEENAFLAHSKMYSDEAVPALLSETKGQNSWVNFGKHLRDENGDIPKRGEKGFVPATERPYADQKAGILPPEIVNPHLGKEPQVGTPIETPSREGTKVVHSNDAGEVRVGSDGRPVVWLSPESWEAFTRVAHPGDKLLGVNYSPEEAAGVAKSLIKANEPGDAQKVLDLFWKAQEVSKQGILTTAKTGTDVSVVAEELYHTWAREMSEDGEIRNQLKPAQWAKLSGIIPPTWNAGLERLGYDRDPVVRVTETAHQFLSGQAKGIIPDTDITRFLDAYFHEVEATHGPNARATLANINDVARQHIEDINAKRNAATSSANERTSPESLRRLEAERQARPAEGSTGKSQEGLASRADEEFNKLSGLKLRVGMGDPGSAGLVTGDNDVLIGRDHADLAREAGYKGTKDEDLYSKFFRDGGVRIRTGGGVAHVDFMEPNADTWDRVYRSIASIPDANRYYVDFRSLKGGTGFNISAYDKDNLLYQLQDLENGGQRPAAPGSVQYFRQGPEADFDRYRDRGPRFPGLASRGSVDFEDIKPHLTDEELAKHDTPEKKALLTAAFNAMPDADEWQAAIKAGRAGQMWYERSSRAFDALLDSGADFISKKDKSKFLNFVAALSPVQPVRSNLLMALNLWSKWDKAGRPTDVEWKDGVPNKNASLWRILKGRGQTQGVDLPARMNNAIRALQGEPLSGPKVSAFTTNLGKDVNRVTNDTWMAVFGGHDPNRINKPAIYDAMSAKVREAANATGIAPRQAQAAIWSFIKSLAELSGWGNDRWIPPQEIIKQGLLTPELVGMHSADFADMLQNDPEIRDAIKKIGGNLDALDTKLKTYVPGKPTEGEAAGASPQLLNAAGRLEAARRDARIANHLARKQEPSLFDTEFRPNTGLFAKDRDNLAPTWYLKSNQLIDSRMQGPMPADTVLKMLENNGVKPDELKYTGLSDFLREKGKAAVRPEEVRDYLAANNLQIQEVTKGSTDNTVLPPGYRLENNVDPEHRFVLRNAAGDPVMSGNDERQLIEEAHLWEGRKDTTKFGTYTLPGGQNYREMLLTLPAESKEYASAFGALQDFRKEMRSKYNSAPYDYTGGQLTPEEQQRENQLVESWKQYSRGQDQFRSSHWDEPNVVGHVRFNDRTGPNGEKLLHLEELQSDWHQKGRTGGYQDTSRAEPIKAEIAAIDKRLKETNESATPEDVRRWRKEGKSDNEIDDLLTEKNQAFSKKYEEDENRRRQLQDQLWSLSSGVPDAPFKKTWPELLMKRMIRYASEHGYDGVSWTPGEEQAARYDLSKHLDNIKVRKTPADYRGPYQLIATDKTGREVIHDWYKDQNAIADAIGKEPAQKLFSGENAERLEAGTHAELKNADLKVGGEGMKGFYDKIVPEVANKLGKQFGAKVQSTKIETGKHPLDESWKPEQARIVKQGEQIQVWAPNANGVDQFKANFSTREAAEKYIADHEPGYKEAKKVPYFPITDSMRESVLKQGQPLFARSPNNGLPDNIDDQIKSNVFKNQPKEYQDLVLNSLRRVASGSLSDRELAAAKFLRDEQNRNFEIGSANDLLHSYIDDYMTRVYKDTNPQGRVILSDAKGGKFATNVSMAKQRVYDSNLTALLKSPKQMLLDPVDITARGRAMLIKAAANRQLIDTLRDNNTRASDGRPAVVLSGSGQVVAGQNGEDPKTFIDPNRVRKINIDPKVVDQLTKSGDLQRFLDDGTIRDITPYVHPNNIQAAIERLEEQSTRKEAQYDQVGNNKLLTQIMYLKSMLNNKDFSGLKDFNDKLEKNYAWDPQDYISLAHNAMKGWNFVTNSPDGNAVFVRSDIKVHPEFAEYLKNRLGLEPSDIAKHPIGKALLGAGTKLKQTLLSLSPFHMVQEALRGIMVGVNPFHITGPDILSGERVDPSDPNSPTIIRKAVEHGFTTGTDYKSLQEHSEGVAAGGDGLLSKIPGVGKTISNSLDWYQSFLFKRYIPALKARSVELMFHEYQRLHPEWSVDKIAKAAAQHTNDTFGGVNWKAMGRSATTQDWGRLLLLAPDWLESEMRSGARLFNKEEGGLGRAQVAKMALGLWGIARVLNLVTTGNAHYEAPFGLAVKNKEGKETVFSIRTLPTDLLHAASDPVGFVQGRLSPVVRTGTELVTQRDQFERKLQPQDLWADAFRQMAPIPLQAVGQAISGTGPQIGNIGQAVKAVGGTAQTYQTPAQKLAADLASSHTESGPIDPAQMARHSRVIQLEDQARAGEISWPDLYKLAYQTDQISESELKTIQENVKATHGLPSDMASLYTRAARLPAKEFLDLWDVTNPSERAALAPLVSKVQKRYLAKAKKEMTPDERAKDPVFQRLVRMIPPNPMQPSS